MSCLIFGVAAAITSTLVIFLPEEDKVLATEPVPTSSTTPPPATTAAPPVTDAPLTSINSIEDYVYHNDGMFSYELLDKTISLFGAHVTFYNMTSQKWLTESDSNRHVWWHIVAFVRPIQQNLQPDKAVLYVTGWDKMYEKGGVALPDANDADIQAGWGIAIKSSSVVAILYNIPAAPIRFTNDPVRDPSNSALPLARTEDQITGYTWDKYARDATGEVTAEWLIEFPMTKAAVRAIDLMEIVVPTLNGNIPLASVTVAGASKRGWTSWLVGAAEASRPNNLPSRVNAIIPIVMDLINVEAFLHRMYRSYSGFTYALAPYLAYDITKLLGVSPNGLSKVFQMNDPWYYKTRLTMPKYLISVGGDEFMMPDNTRYLMPDFEPIGETKLLLLPNGGHMLDGDGVMDSLLSGIVSFVRSVQAGQTRPTITWSIDSTTGEISVQSSVAPKHVAVFYGDSAATPVTSPLRRDFRKGYWDPVNCAGTSGTCHRNPATTNWVNATNVAGVITRVSDTSFKALVDAPTSGSGRFRAFTVELTFDVTVQNTIKFTVPVSVLGDVDFPYADCTGDACGTTIV